jgi:esterase/lipase
MYKNKYLKYKNKYLELKYGGAAFTKNTLLNITVDNYKDNINNVLYLNLTCNKFIYEKIGHKNRKAQIAKIFTNTQNIDNKILYILSAKVKKPDQSKKVSILRIPEPEQLLIVYGFYSDKLSLLANMLCNFEGRILYFGDLTHDTKSKLAGNWYQTEISPDKNSLEYSVEYIKNYIRENNTAHENILFYGSSMGGYAALYASLHFANTKCLAFAPQTTSFENNSNIKFVDLPLVDMGTFSLCKYGIRNIPYLKKTIPQIMNDLQNTTTQIYIFVCRSECRSNYFNIKNEFEPFLLDHLHAGILINNPNVYLTILNCLTHTILGINYDIFRLIENFSNIINEQDPNIIFSNILNYLKNKSKSDPFLNLPNDQELCYGSKIEKNVNLYTHPDIKMSGGSFNWNKFSSSSNLQLPNLSSPESSRSPSPSNLPLPDLSSPESSRPPSPSNLPLPDLSSPESSRPPSPLQTGIKIYSYSDLISINISKKIIDFFILEIKLIFDCDKYNNNKLLEELKQINKNILNEGMIENEHLYVTIENKKHILNDFHLYILNGNMIKNSEPKSNKLFVIFGYFDDKLSYLPKILDTLDQTTNIIYIGDLKNNWYQTNIKNQFQGGEIISKNSIEYSVEYIESFTKNNKIPNENIIFMGSSMGGFASIYASLHFQGSKCFAITPQTINFKENTHIQAHDINFKFTDDTPCKYKLNGLVKFKSISELINNDNKSSLYMLVCKSECNANYLKNDDKLQNYLKKKSPSEQNLSFDHFYLDMLHASSLLKYPNVYLTIFNCNSHALFESYNYDSLLEVIKTVLLDMDLGKQMDEKLIFDLLSSEETFNPKHKIEHFKNLNEDTCTNNKQKKYPIDPNNLIYPNQTEIVY